MGYKCTFMDNDIYYASDVNAMFASLTSEGVALVDSGNLLSDLNAVVAEVTSEGVQDYADSCKLTLSDGVYKIGEGVCFMPDGSAITFDKDGYVISPVSGAKNYIYLKRNETMNTIDVIISQTAGGIGAVPIGEIHEDGAITDTRKYARAKIRLIQPNRIEAFSFTLYGKESADVDVERSDFSRIIINNITVTTSSGIVHKYVPTGDQVLSLSDGQTISTYIHRSGNYSSDILVYITKNANIIHVDASGTHSSATYKFDFETIS